MPLFVRPNVGPAATAVGRSSLRPDQALTTIAELPLPSLFTKWGPFPAVTGVRGQDGRWDHVGASRTGLLGDGGEVLETIVEHRPGIGFAYELTDFTDVFRRLVVGVRGEWSALPDGPGSMLRWTWEFKALPGRRPVVAMLLVPLWQQYMRRLLPRAIALAERTAPAG